MDNLTKTFLYIDLIVFTFIAIFIVINRYFTRSSLDLLTGAPTPNYDININKDTKMGDIYGNLCGTRDEINSQFYLSDNYLSVLDLHDTNSIYYNGAIVPMSPGYAKNDQLSFLNDIDPNLPQNNKRYKILDQFNDIDQSSCRRCYGVNPDIYGTVVGPGAAQKTAYDDMNQCRSRAEDSCRLTCAGEGDNCLGYVMLEKRLTLPPPKRNIKTIPGGLTRDFIRYHQNCIDTNTPNLLQPMHDIQCGLITPETLTRQNSKCVSTEDGLPLVLADCNRNIIEDTACQLGNCEDKPESSFDNYKTIGYTCGHGSGIGGDRGFKLPGSIENSHDNLNYIVQQNNPLNPTRTSESLSDNPPIELTFDSMTFSARGLIKNFSADSTGWRLPTLPIPIQDQWYVPCLASTHLGAGTLDPIDIGTANYKVLNTPSSLISQSPISIDIDITNPAEVWPQIPQALAQKMCEEKCLKQDFTRSPTAQQTTDAPANRNYDCGGYTVTQINSAIKVPSTPVSPVNFDCKIYNKNVETEIPYEYHPLSGPSAQGCPAGSPGPSGITPDCVVPASPDIVVNMCGMKVDMPVSDKAIGMRCPAQAPAPGGPFNCRPTPYASYFPSHESGTFGVWTGETLYNANIAHLIRAGNPLDNNYYNDYIYNQFNPLNGPGSYATCIKDKKRPSSTESVTICDKDIPFGKIRTSSLPPKFMTSPGNDKIAGSSTNMWFPWTVP